MRDEIVSAELGFMGTAEVFVPSIVVEFVEGL